MWGYKWGYLLEKWGYIATCTPNEGRTGWAACLGRLPYDTSRPPLPPGWPGHNLTPLVRFTQQCAGAARITRTAQSQGEPTSGGAGVHRPPSTLSKRDALAHRWGSNYPHHAEPLRTRAQWPRSFRHASRDGRASRSAPHATPDNVHRPFHALSAFLPPLAFLRGNSGNSGNTA